MNKSINKIITSYNPSLINKLDDALNLRVTNFKRDLFPSLLEIDSAIPGAGFQYVIWKDHEPKYPFPGWEFDAISRPMRYIPTFLASGMKFVDIARSIAHFSGGHIEDCLKAFCVKLTPTVLGYEWMPIGRLVKNPTIIRALGSELTQSISEITVVLVNKAKHEFGIGEPTPVISFPDALGGYFASRILGFQVLKKAGIFDRYMEAIQKAYSERICYTMPSGTDPGDDKNAWPLHSELDEEDEY